MLRDSTVADIALRTIAHTLVALYAKQSNEQRTKLLMFFHLLEKPEHVAISLDVTESGAMTLKLESAPG